MAEREIKITFPEVKMEALEFFLGENNTTAETVLKEHLDKTYEKIVPQQVRKFVESKITSQQESVQEEAEPQRQTRGQGRRSTRQNSARETVPEQENSGMQLVEEPEEQENGMIMEM